MKSEHIPVLESLREELGMLRLQGGISDEFVGWHSRLAACANAITQGIPSCADLCKELMSIDFEMPPEVATRMPEELRSHHQGVAATFETFFRYRCGQVEEILKTLIIALRQARR
jgi:hypothetical protein